MSASLTLKICGLSTPATLEAALDAGADMVGFVFVPPSPRHIDIPRARELAAITGGIPWESAPNKFEALATHDTMVEVSGILNTTDAPLLAAYSNLAYGVLPLTVDGPLPDDALKLRAFGKAPPTRHARNSISRMLHASLLPGQVWHLDLGPRHTPDFDQRCFSRLGVDDCSGFAQLTVSPTAGTSSLVEQLQDIIRLSLRRTGNHPRLFRMDFGAEAAVQGRGDDLTVAALSSFLDAVPGCRVVPNAPHAPGWNSLVENTWQRVHGMAYLNHQRARLGPPAWSMMEMAAVW
jgi:hypothetical protein